MNVICQYLGHVLLIAGSLLGYILDRKYKDGRTRKHRLIKAALVIISVSVGALALLSAHLERSQAEEKEIAHRNTLITITNKQELVIRRQEDLARKYERILIAVATNSAPSASIKAALIESQPEFHALNTDVFDLGSLTSDYERKLNIARLTAHEQSEAAARRLVELEKRMREKTHPIFVCALTSLQSLLTERAKNSKERVFSSFTNLPFTSVFPSHVCEIYEGNREKPKWTIDAWIVDRTSSGDWDMYSSGRGRKLVLGCKQVMNRPTPRNRVFHSSFYPVHLVITVATNNTDRVQTTLYNSGNPTITNACFRSNYLQVVNTAVRDFVAAQTLMLASTNKPAK